MPAETSSAIGVCSVTCRIPASPSFTAVQLVDARGDFGLPSGWNSNASPSAQRCSNEWKPPGVIMSAGRGRRRRALHPGLVRGRCRSDGIVGASSGQARGGPRARPVPRGPNSHLCVAGGEEVAAEDRPSSRPRRRSRARRRRKAGCARRRAARVGARDHVRDRAHRRLHAGARVHPGDGDDARRRRERLRRSRCAMAPAAGLGRALVERDLAQRRAAARRCEPQRLVRRVVVVRRSSALRRPRAAAGRRRAVASPIVVLSVSAISSGATPMYAAAGSSIRRSGRRTRAPRRRARGCRRARGGAARSRRAPRVGCDAEQKAGQVHPVGRQRELRAHARQSRRSAGWLGAGGCGLLVVTAEPAAGRGEAGAGRRAQERPS